MIESRKLWLHDLGTVSTKKIQGSNNLVWTRALGCAWLWEIHEETGINPFTRLNNTWSNKIRKMPSRRRIFSYQETNQTPELAVNAKQNYIFQTQKRRAQLQDSISTIRTIGRTKRITSSRPREANPFACIRDATTKGFRGKGPNI